MAWGRLALLQAAGETPAVLAEVAKMLGYQRTIEDSNPPTVAPQLATLAELAGQDKAAIIAELSGIKQSRPAAVFLRISAVRFVQDTQTDKPPYLDDPTLNLENQPAVARSLPFRLANAIIAALAANTFAA